jgi:hypothetical protein
MRKLFDVGWEEARKGYPWRNLPPVIKTAVR